MANGEQIGSNSGLPVFTEFRYIWGMRLLFCSLDSTSDGGSQVQDSVWGNLTSQLLDTPLIRGEAYANWGRRNIQGMEIHIILKITTFDNPMNDENVGTDTWHLER